MYKPQNNVLINYFDKFVVFSEINPATVSVMIPGTEPWPAQLQPSLTHYLLMIVLYIFQIKKGAGPGLKLKEPMIDAVVTCLFCF